MWQKGRVTLQTGLYQIYRQIIIIKFRYYFQTLQYSCNLIKNMKKSYIPIIRACMLIVLVFPNIIYTDSITGAFILMILVDYRQYNGSYTDCISYILIILLILMMVHNVLQIVLIVFLIRIIVLRMVIVVLLIVLVILHI